MRSGKYWNERFKLIEQAEHDRGTAAAHDIDRQYMKAQKDIEAKLDAWYRRFAENNKVSMTDARKMLSGRDLKEFKWDVNEYIRYGQENAINQQWVKELENASARVHISRLEAMKLQLQQQCEVLYGGQLDTIDSAMRGIYLDGYYRTAYEIQKGVGFGWDFGTLDQRKIDKVINKPWASDGRNFSDRVWTNKQKLVNELNQTLAQSIAQGQDPQKAIDLMSKRLNVSKSAAGRLVMTEQAAFTSAAQRDCFSDLDVEQYEIVATLDSHTSDICQEMDGKHFKMSEWEVGVTAPPFHVWCRSTTVPYFDDNFGHPGERAAKDAEGKTYYVPADTTYKEWQKGFVDGDKSGFKEAKPETPKPEVKPKAEVKPENELEAVTDKALDAVRDAYEYKRTVLGANLVPWDELETSAKVNLKGMPVKLAEATANRFTLLSEKYETTCDSIQCVPFDPLLNSVPAETDLQQQLQMSTIQINRNVVKNHEKFLERMKAAVEKGHFPQMDEPMYDDYIITHEYAHSMMDFEKGTKSLVGVDLSKLKNARKEVEQIRNEYMEKLREMEAKYKEVELRALTTFDDKDWAEAQRLSKEFNDFKISGYAEKDINEFWAEAFTDAEIGNNPSVYSKRVQAVAQKYFSKSSATDLMGKPETFKADAFTIKAYEVDGSNGAIFTQTNSSDAQKTIKLIQDGMKNNTTVSKFDRVVVSDKISIAGYEHTNKILYVSEKLSDQQYVDDILAGDYFVAENVEEIIKHELHHKEHWDAISKLVDATGEKDVIIKQKLESDLRKYVAEQSRMQYSYVKEVVSENAYKQFGYDGVLNELIAEVLLQKDKNIVKDNRLLELVEGVVK